MLSSSERRVTIHSTIYPRLKEWAKRDGVTVADVANAILLQTVQPYGPTPNQAIAPTAALPTRQNNFPDPYQTATVSDW